MHKYAAMSFALHEANPGHHLQAVTQNSLKGVPKFITNPVPSSSRLSEAPSRFNMATDYKEGWGLYAESLGENMGLYENPNDLFGYYYVGINFISTNKRLLIRTFVCEGNMVRAARLVVDTGLHSLGWSTEKAVDYIVKNTGFNKMQAKREVKRYCCFVFALTK